MKSSDLWLDKGFSVSSEVELAGAHIGGVFDCTGGQFSNAGGTALSADGLTIARDIRLLKKSRNPPVRGDKVSDLLPCISPSPSNPVAGTCNDRSIGQPEPAFPSVV
jgi:hypothetical protein